MALKTENEITVKVICSAEELKSDLINCGFAKSRSFSMDDHYLVPASLDLDSLSTRDIIAKAVIIRRFTESDGSGFSRITFKKKDINDAGEIISQSAFNCAIQSLGDAMNLFKALGYFEIMNIKEDDDVYMKGDAELAVKYVEGSDILIEFETCEAYQTVDSLKAAMGKFGLRIDRGDFFVKKAEVVLNKILKRL